MRERRRERKRERSHFVYGAFRPNTALGVVVVAADVGLAPPHCWGREAARPMH
jgi:hypothetical protein